MGVAVVLQSKMLAVGLSSPYFTSCLKDFPRLAWSAEVMLAGVPSVAFPHITCELALTRASEERRNCFQNLLPCRETFRVPSPIQVVVFT